MKKRTLKEEILRIRQITYGKPINEQITDSEWLDTVLNRVGSAVGDAIKTVDDPAKADYVTDNVNDFYDSLNSINQPITQQQYGSMEHQKEVEVVQMALVLLGYNLPNHGIDGYFGPETAAAVRKFKNDNNILNEEYIPGIDEMVWNKMPWGMDGGNKVDGINWKGHDTHIHFGFTNPQVAIAVINKAQELGLRASENPYTTGVDKGVHVGNSFHYQVFDGEYDGKKVGKGLDVSGNQEKMLELFNWVSTSLGSGDSVTMTSSPSTQGDSSDSEIVTPEMIQLMSQELVKKGITQQDLDKLIDQVETGGGELYTDLDLTNDSDFYKYETICKEFINRRNSNSAITGDMMANAAKSAFVNYHKYVPPELALAQLALEGGLSQDAKARPIRTNNPFNVGNTATHSKTFTSVQDGINAYYDLIARDYLGKGRTANDLVHNFVNKDDQNYSGSTDGGYEQLLAQIAREANKIARSVA
jgi:hypothetical protein